MSDHEHLIIKSVHCCSLSYSTLLTLTLIMSSSATDKAAARARFEGVFDTIADELLAYLKENGMPADAIKWYKDVSCFQKQALPARYCDD